MKKFTREDRLKAQEESFKKTAKKGGGAFILPDEETLEDTYGITYFKPKGGTTSYLAILPRIDSPTFYYEVFVHYIESTKSSFLCPEMMSGEKCPVCNYRRQLEKENEDKDIINSFRPRKRDLMLIVNMKDKRTMKEGVKLFDAAPSIINGIAGQVVNDRTGEILYDVTEDPVNIVFKRTGEKLNTDYGAFKIEEREWDVPEEFYENLPALDDLIVQPDIEAMKKAVGNIDIVEEDEEKEKPTRKTSRREIEEKEEPVLKKKRRVTEEEEPEEEEVPRKNKKVDDEDEFPFDDDEKPVTKKKVREEEQEETDEKETVRNRIRNKLSHRSRE